jgi:hypothetical protein
MPVIPKEEDDMTITVSNVSLCRWSARRPRWRNLERDFAQNCAQKKDIFAIPIAIILLQRNIGRNFSETSYYIRQALQLTTLFHA